MNVEMLIKSFESFDGYAYDKYVAFNYLIAFVTRSVSEEIVNIVR